MILALCSHDSPPEGLHPTLGPSSKEGKGLVRTSLEEGHRINYTWNIYCKERLTELGRTTKKSYYCLSMVKEMLFMKLICDRTRRNDSKLK